MRIKMGIITGLLLALGAVGCGGSNGGDGVATAGGSGKPTSSATPNGQNAQENALKFAQCMRQHGVNMPDPQGSGGKVDISLPKGMDPHKANAAMQQCKQYLPNGGGAPQKADPKTVAQTRKLAQCMRAHGVPNFPDPNPDGGIDINGGSGIDPSSPAFKAAQKACGAPGGTPESGGGQ